ncbi:unnamed protein product, partial [marine sediment metagenome]
RGLVWKKIVNFLQPDNDLGYLEAIRIDLYSQLGKYLPGKVFAPLGKIYLARNKNISKKNLYLSVVFDAILSIAAAFSISLFLIGFFLDCNINLFNFYLIGLLAVIGGLAATHHRVIQYLIKLFLTKRKKELIDLNFDLSWINRVKIILYYAFVNFWIGFGFFYLIKSITYLSIQNLLSVIGIYILAGVLGLTAFFAPSGLGIREGVLVLFLQFYFPLNIAILISLLARVWTILGDLFLAGGFYLPNIFKKIKYR